MGWRLFAALTPPAGAVAHLEAAVQPLREARSDLRWTKGSMWHLTCAFFGDVAEERTPELKTRLARVAARHDAIELGFTGAGAFGRPARATVLFAGVDGPQPALQALQAIARSCEAAGRRIGLQLDERAYRPHLTLARAKGRAPVDVRPIVEALATYVGPRWTASALDLIRSHQGPQPYYETIASWPLRDYQA